MVNNSININKTNSHLSPPLIDHKKRPFEVRNTGLGLEQAYQCGEVKPLHNTPTASSDKNHILSSNE